MNEPNNNAESRFPVFFIEDGSGLGWVAHLRQEVPHYVEHMLESLMEAHGNANETGFQEDISVKMQMMTQAELEALPDI